MASPCSAALRYERAASSGPWGGVTLWFARAEVEVTVGTLNVCPIVILYVSKLFAEHRALMVVPNCPAILVRLSPDCTAYVIVAPGKRDAVPVAGGAAGAGEVIGFADRERHRTEVRNAQNFA